MGGEAMTGARRRKRRSAGRCTPLGILLRGIGLMTILCLLEFHRPAAGQISGTPTEAPRPSAGWSNIEVKPGAPVRPSPPADAPPQTTSAPVARAIALEGDEQQSTVIVTLSRVTSYDVQLLESPPRLVIDLAGLEFRLPPGAGQEGRGLVQRFRAGLLAPGQARIVLDLAGPARVVRSETEPRRGARPPRLVVDLAATDAATFAALARTPVADGSRLKARIFDDQKVRPGGGVRTGLPVIVIDPGHGGVDPGAIGPKNTYEKNVVLGVARRLRDVLKATGRYEVILTRNSDTFVSLAARVELSQRNGADLFISLHADALAHVPGNDSVRGATIYTLSERASDEAARLLAEKENAADILAGVEEASTPTGEEVKGILFDLMRRETANFSAELAGLLVENLRSRVTLTRETHRSAAFQVLRQPQAPAVLIELGYLSNAADEQLLTSAAWQKKIAEGVATSVERYFARRVAGKR